MVRPLVFAFGLVTVSLLAAAPGCASTGEGAADGATVNNDGQSQSNDTGVSDSGLGPLACGASIDVACGMPANFGLGSPGGPSSSGSGGPPSECIRDWANACDKGEGPVRCGQYNVVGTTVVDVGTDYFYDAMTGQLVAVVYWSSVANKSECIAGPPFFTLPPQYSMGDCMGQTCPGAGSTDEDASVLAAVDAMRSD